jgi:hypothetical protein
VPPSHQLELLLVPREPWLVSRGLALLDRLRAEGVLDAGGAPGPAARRWCSGSFARLWLDDPGRVVLYANRQGGFRVQCPIRGEPIVRAFEAAVTAWRAGGPRELVCPGCGQIHALDDVAASPPLAFGRFAIVTSDVGHADLTPEGLAWAEEELGPTRMVARRG